MDKTIRTLYELFQILCRRQNSTWIHPRPKQAPPTSTQKTWSMLNVSWAPITEKDLEGLFSNPKDLGLNFSESRKVLYLPLLEQNSNFVPILTMQCNLEEIRTDIKLRVMLVCRDTDNGKLCGIGFRMDQGEGRHDFYHAQLIQNLETGPYVERGPVIECPSWIPCTQPSFPVIAKDPITLLLCLIMSLYGIKYFWTFVTEHRIFGIESYLNIINEWIVRPSK